MSSLSVLNRHCPTYIYRLRLMCIPQPFWSILPGLDCVNTKLLSEAWALSTRRMAARQGGIHVDGFPAALEQNGGVLNRRKPDGAG